jgi:DNA-binding MarR family transcriptional regulator
MTLSTGYSDPDDSPGLALWRTTMRWQSQQRATLKSFGLTHVQFVLLAHLASAGTDSPLTQIQLAQRARTDPMMTSQVIRALEKSNLVARTPHPTDARAHLVSLTTAGKDTVNRATPAVEATDRAFFSPIDGQVPEFLHTLQRLNK